MNKACSERVVRGISDASSHRTAPRTLNSCCGRGVVAKIVGERASERPPFVMLALFMQRVRFSPTPAAAHMHNLLELQPSCFTALRVCATLATGPYSAVIFSAKSLRRSSALYYNLISNNAVKIILIFTLYLLLLDIISD
jgi:hypothetical protein